MEAQMTDGADAYSLPTSVEAELVSIYECWQAMRRGDNDMPFWDAVNLSSLGDDAALIDVFENPLRFRLGLAGRSIAAERQTRTPGTSRSSRGAMRKCAISL